MRRDWVRGLLPQGRRLPERDWAARHRVILVVMVGHAIGIFCYALSKGYDPDRCALDAAPVALLTLVASSPSVPRRARSCLATLAAPGAFLPAAERYDLIGAIDRWVVEAAFVAIAGRFALLGTAPNELFSVNLSGRSVDDDSFMIHIRGLLDRYAVPPRAVCFEVTETVAISDLAEATAFITELRSLGCRFALDDFGSGLSSFTYLKRLPVDFVKIDGNFVRDITTDAVDRAMVESVNRISHEMGLRTVAEFVETDATMEVLRLIGVDYAQGWAIGRPEPFDDWSSRTTVLAPSAGSASR